MAFGLDKIQRQVSKSIYADYALHAYGQVIKNVMPIERAIQLNEMYEKDCLEMWQEAQKINKASYRKKKYLQDKIEKMLLKGKCVFLTFTFTDKILDTTKVYTRRQKVRRFLSAYNCEYVANIDYGVKNEREHYHAIIQTDKVDFKKWSYGALNGKTIAKTSDSIKLAKYIAKLTNHAIKQTAKGCRIIYDRI